MWMPTSSGRLTPNCSVRHVAGDDQAFGGWSSAGTGTGCGRSRCAPVCDPEEAADALQDAMISAFRRAPDFRGDSAVTTWLHRIVVMLLLTGFAGRAARPARPGRRRAGLRGLGRVGGRPRPRDRHQARRGRRAADIAAAAAGRPRGRRHARLLGRRCRRHPRHLTGHGEEPLRPRPRPAAAARGSPTREPIGQPERLTCAGRRRMRGQMTHLDTDVLAEFDAGPVTGCRGARIAAHLAVCVLSPPRAARRARRGFRGARRDPGPGHARPGGLTA